MPDPVWTTACPDWEERILARRSLVPCGPLFPAEAEAGLDIFRQLRVVDVAGAPAIGQIALPWSLEFVASIFGAYDPEAGRRLIREWFLLVAKKNWKSGLAAGVMLTALLMNWRQSGEFGILSPTLETANNCFRPARDMIRADDELRDLLHIQEHIRTITHRTSGATLQVVAADADSVAGKKWIGTLVDEVWLFGKKPRAADMLLEATGGMASRPEGFVIYLSTHSDEAPAGVFDQKLKYARGVRDGRIKDPEFLPVLYEYPKAMLDAKSYMDEKNWYITNPNLGASVDESYIRRKVREAQEGGEETLQAVLAKHLNIEIGLSLSSDRWAGADIWQQQARRVSLDEVLRRSEVVCIGIDGGGLEDLLGMAVLGRDPETGEWLLWTRAWAHPSVLERRKEIASKLQGFAEDGDLVLVKRIGEDVLDVARIVRQVYDTGLLHKIGLDPSGVGQIVDAIAAEDIDTEEMVTGVSQGWRLNGAILTAERKLADGTLVHGGQRLMAWCVGNAKVEPKGNAILITKQASGRAKIDPLMAMFNAVSLMAMNPEAMLGGVGIA